MQAVNRYGEVFMNGEEVMMADSPILYKQMIGQLLVIKEIEPFEECESGYMIQLEHKESGKPFKNKLDTNWLKKNKN